MARAKGRHYHSNGNRGRKHIEHGAEAMEDSAEGGVPSGRRQTAQIQRNARPAFETFDIFNVPMAQIMGQNWSSFSKMLHAMQEESVRFVNRRLEHASHAVESSRECQGVSGLMVIQQEWMTDLVRDLAEHSKRCAGLVRELTEETESLAAASSAAMGRGRGKVERDVHAAA